MSYAGAGQYAPVRVDYLCAEERCAAAALENIEIDALALECEAVLLHLGDHLNGMATDGKPRHVSRLKLLLVVPLRVTEWILR